MYHEIVKVENGKISDFKTEKQMNNEYNDLLDRQKAAGEQIANDNRKSSLKSRIGAFLSLTF